MKSISQLASEIRGEKSKPHVDNGFKRLTDTLNKFNEDFKSVICELIKCNVKYEACFWHKEANDGEYIIFPKDTKLDLTISGHGGGICICNSMLFTFEHYGAERKKRLFYNEDNFKGWYYIARRGNCMNDNIYLTDYRKDLILYLDGFFDGEYK